jgi:hypothetical protein
MGHLNSAAKVMTLGTLETADFNTHQGAPILVQNLYIRLLVLQGVVVASCKGSLIF